MKKFKLLTLTLILITSIALNPVYANQKADTKDYRSEYLNLQWWERYNDAALIDYLVIAFQNNQDLKIAVIKTNQAQQIVKQSLAQELPQIGFSGNFQRELRSSDTRFGDLLIPNYSQNHFVLPLAMTYEVDIWGENRLRTKSYKKQLDIIKQDERASYISLTSAVASDYFNLIKTDKLIENQKELISLQKTITEMVEKKHKNGLCPAMEVIAEKQTLTNFEEELNNLEEKREVLKNQFLVLLGDRNITEVKTNNYETINLPEIPENLSTEVIKYRPDLIKTEEYIKKIGFDVKVARREFLPKFLIYGNLGFNAYDWGRMFNSNTFLSSIGVAPSFDLFAGGRKMAYFKYNKLEYEKALQLYEKTVLTSIQEVNDALSGSKTYQKNYLKSHERNALENEKFELLNKKFEIGSASKLDNLKAREITLLTNKSEISNKINYIVSTINIYKAVGGKDYTNFAEDI